jgi:hypothetical protein
MLPISLWYLFSSCSPTNYTKVGIALVEDAKDIAMAWPTRISAKRVEMVDFAGELVHEVLDIISVDPPA